MIPVVSADAAPTPASTDAATTSSIPSKRLLACQVARLHQPHIRLLLEVEREIQDCRTKGQKEPRISLPTTKWTRNDTNFIQFILLSEGEYHEIVVELSRKGSENLCDKINVKHNASHPCLQGWGQLWWRSNCSQRGGPFSSREST
jgi:hypothetical protein